MYGLEKLPLRISINGLDAALDHYFFSGNMDIVELLTEGSNLRQTEEPFKQGIHRWWLDSRNIEVHMRELSYEYAHLLELPAEEFIFTGHTESLTKYSDIRQTSIGTNTFVKEILRNKPGDLNRLFLTNDVKRLQMYVDSQNKGLLESDSEIFCYQILGDEWTVNLLSDGSNLNRESIQSIKIAHQWQLNDSKGLDILVQDTDYCALTGVHDIPLLRKELHKPNLDDARATEIDTQIKSYLSKQQVHPGWLPHIAYRVDSEADLGRLEGFFKSENIAVVQPDTVRKYADGVVNRWYALIPDKLIPEKLLPDNSTEGTVGDANSINSIRHRTVEFLYHPEKPL